MKTERILVTGASGNVGLETLRALINDATRERFEVIAGVRNPAKPIATIPIQPDGTVALDFANSATFEVALRGIDRVLLVRPPQLADVALYFKPFMEAMKRASVRQVVFLSLQGVENNPVTPHHKIEKLIVDSGLPYTFLRPSFFMQNLSTTHRDEIRLRNEIFVPAGNGRTSFIDVQDIGEVAALSLTSQTNEFINQSYELTGSEALTYSEVADVLTDVLGRKITYRNPSILQFIWQKWHKETVPLGFTLTMVALYTVAKLGKAAVLTQETERLLNHPPRTFRQFAEANRSVWMP
ncbi:SDR family oxidoreductase [Spirosoma radiotolerans]|uniref:NmrA family transcriptional regulator n=1 Tax=Spirosoma radiotolerans TaxID=1379870 RepID=A0A0E3VAT1_9BACT|nr:SDR family oxidoreductase [Spirosoma radiotolerans]AKD58616.1 NmrA family transcriptional regulator [Spirosoma radiotolerans]